MGRNVFVTVACASGVREIYREQKGPPWGSGTPLGACQTMKTSGYARPLAYPLVFGPTRELFKVSVRP